MRLLLIEHDRTFGGWLAERLSASGFGVIRNDSAEQALRDGFMERATAVIIDVGPSGLEGPALIRPIREAGHEQPVLILSARAGWREKVESLDAGADDYLIKPVRPEEVAARLRAVIRREAGSCNDRIALGEIELDLKGMNAWLAGQLLELTRNEFRLLRLFLLREGRVLAHHEIRDHLYANARDRSLNAVEVHVARLRRKIGRDKIRTIRRVGYRLDA